MTETATDVGRTGAPKKEFAPVICLSTSLSTGGTRLVEAAGYFDALNHLNALTEFDSMRPRSKLADLRDAIKDVSSAIDAYEAALAAEVGR